MNKIFSALFGFIFIVIPSIGLCEIIVAKDFKKTMEIDTSTIDARRIKGSITFYLEVKYFAPYKIDEFLSQESEMVVSADCAAGTLRVLKDQALLLKNDSGKTIFRNDSNERFDSWNTPFSTKDLITKACSAATKEGLISPVKTYASLKDLPAREEVELASLPKSLIPQICKNIDRVDQNILSSVLEWNAPIMNSAALAKIYRNGAGGATGVRMVGDACVVNFQVSGSLNGSSYNGQMNCSVSKVQKFDSNKPNLTATWVDTSSCR